MLKSRFNNILQDLIVLGASRIPKSDVVHFIPELLNLLPKVMSAKMLGVFGGVTGLKVIHVKNNAANILHNFSD
jgi:hypothetical protein